MLKLYQVEAQPWPCLTQLVNLVDSRRSHVFPAFRHLHGVPRTNLADFVDAAHYDTRMIDVGDKI